MTASERDRRFGHEVFQLHNSSVSRPGRPVHLLYNAPQEQWEQRIGAYYDPIARPTYFLLVQKSFYRA